MMNYKETLFFVAKCLTISLEQQNKEWVKKTIESNKVNWDKVVQLSTAHYVFPALYCNLKRADFLSLLPSDLVDYMQHITALNRERNEQIIQQAKEINELLLANNISPIFLKGTGNLLEGLYEDIAERMVGDIDVLVAKDEFQKAIKVIKNDGYEKTNKKLTSPIIVKHYPRLFKKRKISAIEIHIEMCKKHASKYYNYESVSDSFIKNSTYNFLGYQDQLNLTILSNQYNDNGRFYKMISLRNSYDIYLLSKKVNSLTAIKKYKKLFNVLNSYLAVTSKLMNTSTIYYENNIKAKQFINISLAKISYPSLGRLHNSFLNMLIYSYLKFQGLNRFISNKKFRNYYIKKIKENL